MKIILFFREDNSWQMSFSIVVRPIEVQFYASLS